jgi:hypothetical protein
MMRQNTLPDRVFRQFPTFHFTPFQSQRVQWAMLRKPPSMLQLCARAHLQNDFPDRAPIRK